MLFDIIIAVATLVSLAVSVGMGLANRQTPPGQTPAESLSGPRSSYGDAVSIIFGTVQIESPVAIYGGNVNTDSPFPEDAAFTQADYTTPQYSVTLDLLFARRIFKNGSPLQAVTLRKIWYGSNLLWNGTGFAVKVTNTTTLLQADPNRFLAYPNLPGGVVSIYEAGSGAWYFGGVTERSSPSSAGGNVLGSWTYFHNGTEFTTGLGLERIAFYSGSGLDGPNASLVALCGDYPGYPGMVRLVFDNYCFGTQPNLENVSAEMTFSCPAPEIGDSTGLIGLDVNPISVLYQLLTMPEFCGGAKTPPVDIPSFSAARAAIASEALGMSYRLQAATKASDVVEMILSHVDGILFIEPETGEIHIALNRPAASVTTLPTYNETTLLEPPSDFAKTTWQSTYSQRRMTFELRGSAANGMSAKSVAVADDPALIASNGMLETLDGSSATAFDQNVANAICNRELAIANTPLIKTSLKFSRQLVNGTSPKDLRPGDLFNFTYSPWGITRVTLRVLSVDFGTLEANGVTVNVIQDRFVGDPIVATPIPSQAPATVPLRPNVSIPAARVITAPYAFARMGLAADARKILTSGQVIGDIYAIPSGFNFDRFLVLAAKPYPSAGAFDCELRDTDTGRTIETKRVPYTMRGVLQTAILSTDGGTGGVGDYRMTGGTSILITGLTATEIATLSSGPVNRDGKNLILIDDEWFLIEAFTSTSTTITITILHRMLWDSPYLTTAVSGDYKPGHSIGADVWFFDARDIEANRKKLSQPLPSNEAITYGNGGVTNLPAIRPFPYASGYNTAKYTHTLKNADSSKNNIAGTITSQLADRANRMNPIRRMLISGYDSTGGASLGGGGFSATLTGLPSARTQFEFNYAFSASVGGPQPFSPRESTKLVTPFDSNAYPIPFAEENDPLIAGFPTGTGFRKDRDAVRVTPVGGGAGSDYARGTNGWIIPVTTGLATITRDIWISRSYASFQASATRVAVVAQWSEPVAMRLTIQRV